MKYKNKTISLKFDNATSFRFISEGVSISDLLVSQGANIERFCKAWSILLNEEYKDANSFMEGFGKDFKPVELNELVISALERDGIIEPENETKKKKLKR